MMSFLFIGRSGEAFRVAPEDLSLPSSPNPYASFDGASAADPMNKVQQETLAIETSPLIVVSDINDPLDDLLVLLRRKKASSRRQRSVFDQSGNGSGFELQKVLFTHNGYGELMDVEKLKCPVNSADLTATETLRLILKAYHNEVFQIILFDNCGQGIC